MTTRRSRLALVGSLSGLIWITNPGCSRPILSVEDAVVMGGRSTDMVAHVESPRGLGFRKGMDQQEVHFSVNGRTVGECDTSKHGQAQSQCNVPESGCDRYVADVMVNGKTLRKEGRVFNWEDKRTIIAVDIDETLSVTDYLDLMFTPHDGGSRPIRGAVQAMNALAREYNIAYVTSRPRFMIERSRTWLREHGFPEGPVIGAASWAEWRSQTGFKRRKLESLRQQWPNLLIGIGDKQVDVDAYTDNHMLTLIVNERKARRYGNRAVTFRDWRALASYFVENRELLSNPQMLATRIDRNGRLRPAPKDALVERTQPGFQQSPAFSRVAPQATFKRSQNSPG